MSQQGTPPVPPQQQQQQQQQAQQAQQQRFDQLMQNLGQATEAMANEAQTAPATVEAPPRPATPPFDTGGKILKPPDAFNPATLEEEEVSQWSDWAFTFKNLLAFMIKIFLRICKRLKKKQRR